MFGPLKCLHFKTVPDVDDSRLLILNVFSACELLRTIVHPIMSCVSILIYLVVVFKILPANGSPRSLFTVALEHSDTTNGERRFATRARYEADK